MASVIYRESVRGILRRFSEGFNRVLGDFTRYSLRDFRKGFNALQWISGGLQGLNRREVNGGLNEVV